MYTIGEFSRLCHVSARMLRHYDAIGLLRPAHTGPENGYRYYDPAQLETLLLIERLKSYGFSLSQTAELLTLPREELMQRIHSRRLQAYSELQALRATLRRMEEELIKTEGISMFSDNYPVILMTEPAQRVFSIRKTICISEVHDLFQELYAEAAKRGLTRSGATQLLYLGEEFNYERMDVEAQMQVAGEHPDVREIPEQLCVATTHTGPYDTVNHAYDALCAWLAQHPDYKIAGPGIERYLKDEEMVRSPEELETGVLFPVQKKG